MFNKGLGERAEFYHYHPTINIFYFVIVITMTMFSTSPVFLATSIIGAWTYSILLKGKAVIKNNMIITLFTLVMMSIINAIFTHTGETVLFYFNHNRITLEAFFYGLGSALMLSAVVIWFSAFNVIISSDKLIYLFGKIMPVIGLTLSMILRFIPLLKNRFSQIRQGQNAMGRGEQRGIINKSRLLSKEVSILIAWSLESSIESSDSMEARGYGLPGRTSFNLFKITQRDIVLFVTMVILAAIMFVGVSLNKTTMYYFPKITFEKVDLTTMITLAAYTIVIFTPIVIDILGEKRWEK